MRCKQAFLAILCGLSIARCATRAGGVPGTSLAEGNFSSWFRHDLVPVRRVLPASLDSVWAALPEVFAHYGYPGGPSVLAEERVYLSPPLKVQRRLYTNARNSVYLDCGLTPAGVLAADVYVVSFSILAQLRPQDSGTMAEIFIGGTARDPAQKSDPVYCTGTGRLETAFLQRLETQTRLPRARLVN